MTSEPMVESTKPGDYRIVDKDGFLSSMIVPMIEGSNTSQKFICVNNEWDSRQFTGGTASSN